jgi:MAF protein
VTDKTVLVLASNSPRRHQLLSLGGWMFSAQPADVDERTVKGEAPSDYVTRLAREKALACSRFAHAGQVIVAADTAVVDGKDILGKPKNMADASGMLRRLRNHTHQVYTGIAVIRMRDGHLVTDLCITDVPMRDYSDEEIDAYIVTGDPLDKAGGYAIQHPKLQPVESLRGCYASVMGLPLCHLSRTLRQLNVRTNADIPGNCQSALDYRCPIFSDVLRGENVG